MASLLTTFTRQQDPSGEGNQSYYPIPPVQYPDSPLDVLRSEQLLVRCASPSARATWRTAGWLWFLASISDRQVLSERYFLPLNTTYVLIVPPSAFYPYRLLFEFPWWIEVIHVEVLEV